MIEKVSLGKSGAECNGHFRSKTSFNKDYIVVTPEPTGNRYLFGIELLSPKV
jgi:hypothetical protein